MRYVLFEDPFKTSSPHKNIIIDKSLIGKLGQDAIAEYVANAKKEQEEIEVQEEKETEKAESVKEEIKREGNCTLYSLKEDIKLAVFYEGKRALINGTDYSLNYTLSSASKIGIKILKVVFYQGNSKENDCYHVIYEVIK